MKKLQFCLVYFSLLVLVLGAAAQVQNGQFTGTVTDPSGAAIANAKVTVTNMGTNLSVTTTTDQTGPTRSANCRSGPTRSQRRPRVSRPQQHQHGIERRNHLSASTSRCNSVRPGKSLK